MSLSTFSVFYYGFSVDIDNYQFDFKEAGGELTAELNFGDYTLTEYAVELASALNTAGSYSYAVAVNRTSRQITITATGGNIQLLTTTGTHGTEAFDMMGFSGADKTGATHYTGGSAAGSSYEPQFKLQSYIPPENFKKRMFITVHETATGAVETVSFGDLEMIEMDIRFATNIVQPTISPIRNSGTGVEDLNTFMRALITKNPLEFMPDINTPSTYYKVILETTTEDQKGIGYKLKERIDLGLCGYYDTEKLTFRVI